MTVVQALVLGLVQGLTEFVPISSSGHLVVVPALLGWEKPALAFDVFLHGATLAAVAVYFRRELVRLLLGFTKPGPGRRLLIYLIVGTIPAAVVGFVFEERVARFFEDPLGSSLFLIMTGAVLIGSELLARARRSNESDRHDDKSGDSDTVEDLEASLNVVKAAAVGAAQAVAILPGLSRSGLTIGAGLVTGLKRQDAARFSFLLSIPILAGAVATQIPDMSGLDIGAAPLVVGGVSAFLSAYLSVAALIGYLQRRGLYPFAVYCIVAGTIYSLLLR